MKLINIKKNRGSLDCYPLGDFFLVLSFIVVATIGVSIIYNKVMKVQKLHNIDHKIAIITRNEELVNFHTNSQNFTYAESKNYSIYSPEQFVLECLSDEKLDDKKWEELKVIFDLNTIKNDEINEYKKIVKIKDNAFKSLSCKGFSYQDDILKYNNKPVYFYTKKYQFYEKRS
jgi:hypothetical protein